MRLETLEKRMDELEETLKETQEIAVELVRTMERLGARRD